MTVFTTIVKPDDLHDSRFYSPMKVSPTIEYQIQPISYLSLYHIQRYINDISIIPNKIHCNSVISISISNNSFLSYKKFNLLKQHIDILWINCKIQRLDLDFTQFTFKNQIVIQKIIAIINHLQKLNNYNLFSSISIPINKDLKINDEFLTLLSIFFKNEFIQFNLINFLIPKDFKRKNLNWLEMTKIVYLNISKQLKDFDKDNQIFIGNFSKYIGIIYDCDIVNNENNIKNTVRQNLRHGERRNMSENEFKDIWKWGNKIKLGQIKLKSYLTNSKHILNLIENNNYLINNDYLMLPKNILFKLADELGLKNLTINNYNNNIDNSSSNLKNKQLPDYDTVILEKITEYEDSMNKLIKLPSYKKISS